MTQQANLIQFNVKNGGKLTGECRVPGDKSISHRSIMLGSIAEGTTEVKGFLEGEDSLATLKAFQDMGVTIEKTDHGTLKIQGVGLNGLKKPEKALDLGNSGTSMRLLSGLMAGQAFASTLIGDASLSSRPMGRVTKPLATMGAKIQATEKDTAPLHISPADHLIGIEYAMPVASAQVKSSLLLAGLYAQGQTCISEPAPTRDHTERMLQGFGYQVTHQKGKICLQGGGKLTATTLDIPADISSAAFFLVGASIAPDSDLILKHVGLNPTRDGVIQILRLMGANIDIQNQRDIGGETVADLRVRSSALHGIPIPIDQVPLAIDEFPVLFIAAACAEGVTILSGAKELRVKESDRIQVMADGLAQLGIECETKADGIVIYGGQLTGGCVHSHGDHRIAMAFAIAALRATAPIEIEDCANVKTSFPDFITLAQKVGLQVTQKND